jgi:S1-C subfamily serine protease
VLILNWIALRQLDSFKLQEAKNMLGLIRIVILLALIPLSTTAQNLPRRDRVRLDKMSSSLQKLAQHVNYAVVKVMTKGYYPVQADSIDVATQSGTGAGVILDANGYIVTNAHVIDGAQEIEVLLSTDLKIL